MASSGYSSATFQRPSTSMTGKSMSSGIGGGVNMRQNKSIGGVQRPVSAILPQSSAVNRRQETMETYNDGRYSPVVRCLLSANKEAITNFVLFSLEYSRTSSCENGTENNAGSPKGIRIASSIRNCSSYSGWCSKWSSKIHQRNTTSLKCRLL